MTDALNLSIASDLHELKKTLNFVLAQIRKNKPQISDDDFMDLRLIFSELLSNAIIHGNKSDVHKKVCVVIEFTDESIVSKITDEGSGFNYAEVLKPKDPFDDFLSESGRGIRLVSVLTDELKFYGKGNEIRFSKKFVYIIPENNTSRVSSSNKCLAAVI